MAEQCSDEFVSGLSTFTVNLYKLLSVEGNDNVILSPFSISAALLLADLGANNATERQIRDVLCTKDISKEDVMKQYKSLQTYLNTEVMGPNTLVIANKMFACLGLQVNPKYITDTKAFFDSEHKLLDFVGQPEESRIDINRWVEEKTERKIKDILPVDAIYSSTVMVLVNAVYFKCNWLEPFKVNQTVKMDFHMKNGTRNIDMMTAQRDTKFQRDKGLCYSAIQLPYSSSTVAMVFILPDKNNGLTKLEQKMISGKLTSLCNGFNRCRESDVSMAIPKFKMEASFNLKTVLRKLGIKDMFDPSYADFGAMLPSSYPNTHVSEVVHKAFIEVNEEGTEAAAATAMVMDVGCSIAQKKKRKQFILDHPFIFLVRDTKTGVILFMGRYTQPTEYINPITNKDLRKKKLFCCV